MLRRERKKTIAQRLTAFLVWTRWIQGIWKNQQKWAVKASLRRDLILRCSIFFSSFSSSSFKYHLGLILDWLFSQFCIFFSFLDTLLFPWLTLLLLLTEIIFERAHYGKHFGNAHAWAACLFHLQITRTRAKKDLFCSQTRKGECRW